MDPYLAEIRLFGGNFAPSEFAFCDGKLISIAENSALFALIGTTYGGDGQYTFALPDLRGRVPVGTGSGPGLPSIELGQKWGTETMTLLSNNLPAHTHQGTLAAVVNSGSGTGEGPTGAYWGKSSESIYSPSADSTLMNAGAVQVTAQVGSTGSNAPVNAMQPYLALNYIICTEGIFPSRN